MFAFLLFICYKSLDQLHNSLSSCYFKCNWISKEFFYALGRQTSLYREFVNFYFLRIIYLILQQITIDLLIVTLDNGY